MIHHAVWTQVVFADPLDVYSTDIVEIDVKRGQARLVNSAGKIKAITKFTYGVHEVEDGPQVRTG